MLEFRSGDGDFVALDEGSAHVVEKRLWAEVNVDGVGAAGHREMSGVFFFALGGELHVLDSDLEFRFGGDVVLGRPGLSEEEDGGHCEQRCRGLE